MSKKEKTEKEKQKKKKLSCRRSFSNIVFALSQVWSVSRVYLFLYFALTFIYAPLDFLTDSYLLRVIVDGIEESRDVYGIAVYILVVGVVSVAVNMISNYYWNVISPPLTRKISANLQKKLFRKASEVDLACYETPSFYDKYVKAFDETSSRIYKVLNTINNLVWRIISLLCNSFLLFFIDPWLIVFGLLPLLLGFVRRWANKLYHDHVAAQKPVERKIKYIRRTFYLNDYSKEMRIGGMHERMLAQLQTTYDEFRGLRIRFGIKRAFAKYIQNVGMDVVAVLGAMFYAVWRTTADGSMSIGDCIVILNSIGTISWCLNNLVQNISEFGEHSLFLEDVRYFLDYEPKIKDAPDAPEVKGGDIELDAVSFRYEGAESDALSDVCIKIREGEHIAIVGQNGSGKTTLIKLLLRFYDPTSGSVKLDGKDIREYRLSSYRDSFGVVQQDFRMFSLSVAENVLMRRRESGDDELVAESLRESGAYDRVMSLEGGIDTTLTREFDNEGANLSVGEAQKVALARVFSKNTPFIILDEPSSALDPVAEHKMFENMMRAARGRSMVFISHRLSSAVDADRIYLLEGGRVVEEGTHAELLCADGRYAEMFKLQAENYVGEEVRL